MEVTPCSLTIVVSTLYVPVYLPGHTCNLILAVSRGYTVQMPGHNRWNELEWLKVKEVNIVLELEDM
jgi:hypothetical protein